MHMPRISRRGAAAVLSAAVVAVVAAAPAQGRPAAEGGAVTAQAGAPLPQVMECFRLASGDDPNATVFLTTDNFGNDLVQVRQARAYCESALKLRNGTIFGNTVKHGFECYNVQKGNVINDPYLLTTQNFGPDKVIVRQLVMLCESALKVRPDLPGQVYGSVEPVHVLACYSLAQGDDPNAPVVLRTDNFKDDDVIVRRAFMMCEEARKVHPMNGQVVTFGQPTGLVWECYEVQKGVQQQVPAGLRTRNFGPDQVVIANGTSMCEQAKKTPLFTHDDGGPVDPTGAEAVSAE